MDGTLPETSGALTGTNGGPVAPQELAAPSAPLAHRVTVAADFRVDRAGHRAPEGGAPGVMPRILVVDDDADAANALASLLQSSGYGDARVAQTGATALALAFEFIPTVTLMDLDLPDMSGYDVARQLSQHPRLQNLRLIALTTSSERRGRELAREAGVERYLSKPVSPADLDELFT